MYVCVFVVLTVPPTICANSHFSRALATFVIVSLLISVPPLGVNDISFNMDFPDS